eukprot:scaffold349_cov352-Prasinococcus_capsulatus_cf.AAC.13
MRRPPSLRSARTRRCDRSLACIAACFAERRATLSVRCRSKRAAGAACRWAAWAPPWARR